MKMNCIYLAETKVFQDENAIPCSSDSTGGLEEDNCLYFVIPELKLELFEKVSRNLPLILDVGRSKNSSICNQKSCPCSNELIFPNYINFISPNRKFAQHFIGSEELSSDSIHIFCRTESLLNIPVNVRYMFKSLKMRRRTRSINDLGDFIVECSPATRSVNVIVSPSGRWIFDSIEAIVKARTFIKSSLFFKLGNSDDTVGHIRSRSTGTRRIEFSELTSAPSGHFDTSSQKPMMAVIPFRKQKTMSNFSKEMLLFCSATDFPCSYQSSSSAHHFTSTGLLRCVWKGGTPHFVFSLNDDPRELYLANPLKIKSSVDRAMDYMYLFHSKTDSRKDSRNPINGASNVVGKMKVSSTLVLNSNRSKFIETKFVLFGANGDHFKEMPSSSSPIMKSKGLSKKVAGIFRPSPSSKHTSTHKVGEASSQSEGLEEVFIGEVSNIDESFALNHLADDFPPNFELAAIVVEDYQHDSNKLAASGGWGLSFLNRASHADNCPEPSSASKNREEILMRNSRKSARRMNVLVPAGFHGGPITRTGGPSSLVERWRSGGHCDCGGWDVGCPLTVLDNCCIHSKTSPPEESREDLSSVDLFMEGAKHGEPTLKLVNSSEGLYIIYFQSTLSALQSFSAAVAIIHTQTPDLYPNL
ncbi:uncharacterized protein LOC103697417 [Phoenix dactylifera]|uniref:Uncharacterized protein LOC103697417 n=1 Tax=Phoenix dactylifera TaxID=42345 RepID=A0A8B8ZFU4_PHODC|nr:uncharacterized protein LOC103697417 [Phoenix dactylifera]XP_038973021.1 uncharacterized protein LOC103697417 [Phoenix dactylifera]